MPGPKYSKKKKERFSELVDTISHSDRGSQGRFNWSSQHLEFVEVSDGLSATRSRPSGPSEVEVAWSSEVPREVEAAFWVEIAKGVPY